MSKLMNLAPILSEKAYGLSQKSRTYTFKVPLSVSKQSIAGAVEAQFGVTVTDVNVANVIGKPKMSYRRGGRPISTKRNDSRKAYVTLKSGDSIPFYAAEEAEEKAAAKAAKKSSKEKK